MFLCAMEETFERIETDRGVLLVLHHAGIIVPDERIAHLLDVLDDRDTSSMHGSGGKR